MKINQILILSFGTFFASCNMQAESSLLQSFEEVKSEVSSSIKDHLQEAKDDWDGIIGHIEEALGFAKNAKIAETSIKQHSETSKRVKEKLHKKLNGPDTKKINEYSSVSEKSQSKADSQRRKAKHLAKTIKDHLKETARLSKENHKKIIAAHDETQKTLSNADKNDKTNKDKAKKN